ncbi:PI-PLC X domain-containing protein At5g67130 [Linum perenne]
MGSCWIGNNRNSRWLLMIGAGVVVATLCSSPAYGCSDGQCKEGEACSSDKDCGGGLYCFSCFVKLSSGSRCVRSTATNQFQILNNSLPFNKYAFLTTHNAFAIDGYQQHTPIPRLTETNQEDSITHQLNNGVRALMLDTYDFQGDVWMCHSFGGKCYDFTAFGPAIDYLKEIEAFMSENPAEILTIILEDYVHAEKGLTKVFTDSGLMKYWFPISKMPKSGGDWPLVSDMVNNNQRLLVFTSVRSKEESEGIAYQWNYMVENQYGDGGMKEGSCPNRGESSTLNDTTKSLVLVNFFRSIPMKELACGDNSGNLMEMLPTCEAASGNRWANFLAVDYYKRSEGGGAFQALDTLNGKLLCGCSDVHGCVNNSLPFNKYAFLTTHNAFAIDGYQQHTPIPRLTETNQEDSITHQLNNGVRALMLDTYDFQGDVWMCHSFGGKCYDFTAFGPAIDYLKEIEAFMSENPAEILTIILEDYVHAEKGLTKVFTDSGLMKYWFPISKMPKSGGDWPLVSDMVNNNQRLLVFTSVRSKEESEGIAYQWNYMVENQYGDGGMKEGSCPNRGESSTLNDTTKSLVLVNFFRSIPMKELACGDNSGNLMEMLPTCEAASGNRWANFLAVDYYKRSEGGGAFQALDTLNGKLLCGCSDVHGCVTGSGPAVCNP